MARIRVCQVMEAMVGGTLKHLRLLVDALPEEEFDLHVVCSTRRGAAGRLAVEEMRRQGRQVTILPMARAPHPWFDGVSLYRLRQHLRKHPCDILHLHSAKAGWLGRLAALGVPCKVLYSPHAFPFQQRVVPPLPFLYRMAERVAAPRTDVLVAVSAAEGRVAIENGVAPPERVRVLPNAVHALNGAAPARRREASEPPVVGLIGELRTQKDPLTFLRAAVLLGRRNPAVRFAAPSIGSLRGYAQRFVERHGLARRFDFIDTDESLDPLFERIEIGVLPSLWEGLPYSLLEALAAGIPVIGSDIPPLQELLSPIDAALVFPAHDHRTLAERVEALLSMAPEERRELGARGKALVEREHAMTDWAEQIRALYRSVAALRPQPSRPPA